MFIKRKINSHSTPFLLLLCIHFIMLCLLLTKSKMKHKKMLLIANIGLAYLFEYVVLNVLRGYRYRPKLLKKPPFDNMLGAILSQAIYVPITATFLSVFKKNWYWKAFFITYFSIIEHFFIHLKVYTVNWWKPIYTMFFLPIAFFISDELKKALEKENDYVKKCIHYLAILVVHVTCLYIKAVNKKVKFKYGFFHTYKKHFLLAPIYSMSQAALLTITSAKQGIYPKAAMLFASFITDAIIYHYGFVKLKLKSKLQRIFFHCMMIFFSRSFYLSLWRN